MAFLGLWIFMAQDTYRPIFVVVAALQIQMLFKRLFCNNFCHNPSININ